MNKDHSAAKSSLGLKLKRYDHDMAPFPGSSKLLITTEVPVATSPRQYYLDHPATTGPPFISSSAFVPRALTRHLMRCKKDSAIGVKFQSGRTPPDAITNMEGAMHTFVTPVVLSAMHGDYVYHNGHGVVAFKDNEGMQQARIVIVSAAVQPDFETTQIMLLVCALQHDEIIGQALPEDFAILDTKSKQDPSLRAKYDGMLRRHMVQHLTKDGRLPSMYEVQDQIMTVQQTMKFLEDYIGCPSSTSENMHNMYLRLENRAVISLEVLFNTAINQLKNEISALELLAPQGYVYTSDPAAILAREIKASLLNRIYFAALKNISSNNEFRNMKVFGFNDYADMGAVGLLKQALNSQRHVKVVPKASLFEGRAGIYKSLPNSETEDSLLVIHNNSDAFGQNVESEWASGSLDGAVGANSSAAASLCRDRADLVDFKQRYL